MFKKPIENVRQSLIKSSQKRQLKLDIVKAFPLLTVEDLEVLMPSKQDMYTATISGTKMIIYLSASKEPLFFDLRGNGDLFPTVYAMWILPVFLPTFVIQPETFHFIQGGAGMFLALVIPFSSVDLMLPGVIEPEGGFPNFLVGEKYTITLKDTQYDSDRE
jgi:translation initiation factor 2D